MKSRFVLAMVLAFCSIQSATARDMYAYPKAGQGAQQQSQDDFECYRWASQKTGYNIRQPASSGNQSSTSTVQGAMVGALMGLAIGEIASGKGGEGAAIGALLGGARGHQKGQRRAQSRATSEQDAYNRAYKACMEARDYSVY